MPSVERDAAIEEGILVDLLTRAQEAQDPDAFDGIYLLYADRVYRYLLARLSDPVRSEEIASQIFVHLIERIGKYNIAPADNVAIFSAWLYRMAYNKMVDIMRRENRTVHMPLDYAQTMRSSEPGPEGVVAQLEFERILQKLNLLNDAQRDVILLRFVEEYNIAETATIMQKTEGAVKALQHRALENLRQLLVD
jgi:RNA polymerase sigma-70 factor (ECF subfamily)